MQNMYESRASSLFILFNFYAHTYALLLLAIVNDRQNPAREDNK